MTNPNISQAASRWFLSYSRHEVYMADGSRVPASAALCALDTPVSLGLARFTDGAAEASCCSQR